MSWGKLCKAQGKLWGQSRGHLDRKRETGCSLMKILYARFIPTLLIMHNVFVMKKKTGLIWCCLLLDQSENGSVEYFEKRARTWVKSSDSQSWALLFPLLVFAQGMSLFVRKLHPFLSCVAGSSYPKTDFLKTKNIVLWCQLMWCLFSYIPQHKSITEMLQATNNFHGKLLIMGPKGPKGPP